MTIGNTIAYYRKRMSITQEALAQQLGVTNQAVSKWETDQACPDIQLLPALADIFSITLDEPSQLKNNRKSARSTGRFFAIPSCKLLENMVN